MDRVQVLKRESSFGGGDPTEEQPWEEPIEAQEDAIEAAGVYLQDTSNYDEDVLLSRSGDNMTFKDASNPSPVTLTTLLSSSSGITEPDHEALDTLVHDINENSYDEVVRAGPRVTNVITWDSSAKTTRIRDVSFTYSGSRVTQVTTRQYNASGSVLQTLTETFTYVGGSRRVSSITRTKS
jgi:hypothetical protein